MEGSIQQLDAFSTALATTEQKIKWFVKVTEKRLALKKYLVRQKLPARL